MNGAVEGTEKLITNLINESKSIAVIPSKVAGADAYAAGVGLYHALKGLGGEDKEISLVYPGKIPEGMEGLVEVGAALSDVGKRSLIISIDYSQTPASKAHYTTKGDVLEVVLSPVNRDFSLDNIKTELRGFSFDLIFTVGAQHLNDFGQTYRELETEFGSAKIVNLDNTVTNQRFGTVDVIRDQEPNLSMLILNSIHTWGLHINPAAAEALLKGALLAKLR